MKKHNKMETYYSGLEELLNTEAMANYNLFIVNLNINGNTFKLTNLIIYKSVDLHFLLITLTSLQHLWFYLNFVLHL